ncbi:MAG: hypothetical protein JJU13_21490 [Balneolaceae bacterium]|nr:hypothetical protein [Balneolaceae bacterium]
MNKITIIGILLFGIGILLISPLIASSLSIFAGVISQILGLFLTTKGAIISRKQVVQDSEGNLKSYFESEIKEFRQELSAVKQIDENKELLKIETKFDDWAEEFESNKNLKVLELNREEIKKKEHEELLNKEWLKTYQTIFSILEELLKSYSKIPNSSVSKVEFPRFPSKLISKEAAHYFAKIHFSDLFLYIALSVRSPELENIIPEILFTIDKQDRDLNASIYAGELYWSADSKLIFKIDGEKNWVYWSKDQNKIIDDDAVIYEIPKSSKEWEKILKNILEHVIAKAEIKYNYT